MERRFLFEDGHDDNHKHSHHHHSDHPADHHDFIPSTNEEVLADIKHSLRGSDLRFGKRRRVQGESYAHWVDVFVEIDYTLCTDCATEIGPNTINYSEFRVEVFIITFVRFHSCQAILFALLIQ